VTEPAPAVPDLRPLDERMRDHGTQLMLRLLSVIRIGRTYQVGNQVFQVQVDGLVRALQAIFAETTEAVLVALDSDLYLNGVRVPMRNSNFRHHEALLEEFRRRKIAGLKFDSGVDPREIEAFFALFMRPDEYHGSALLEAAIANGCDRIQPAIFATTVAPGEDDGPIGPSSREEGGGYYAGGHGGAVPLGGAVMPSSGEDGATGEGAPRGAPRKTYGMAVQGARSLLTTTALQDGMEMRHAKRVVQPLVDGAFDSEPVLVGLSTLGHHDEFTYMHAVNVCMVAVTMGHVLGLDRRALADLGVASLLHDVGKNEVAAKIHHPLEAFDPDERAAAESHTVLGARLLARSTTLNPTTIRCMRVALEHHMAAGAGYPAIPGWTPSVLSELVAVADCYVSLLTHRSPRGRSVTPADALGMVMGPLADRFDPALLWALVRSVGLYPPGQMVMMDDGSIALVLAPNPGDLARPHLRLVVDSLGKRIETDPPTEFRPLPADRNIRRALKAPEYPDAAAA
jgi:HD-GYP domain-containing protein (c-di-GMP phosphodiesterase class II)